MAKMTSASSTGGANGPRPDEGKKNTASQPARSSLFDAVDDDDMELAGGTQTPEPTQAARGSHGLASIHDTDRRVHLDAHDDSFYETHVDQDSMEEFENPKNLVAPKPREGFAQCWIDWFEPGGTVRSSVMQMIKRGWRPRDPSSIPKAEFSFYERRQSNDGEIIVTRDMVLCEMPQERLDRIEEAERQQARRLLQATMDPVREANRAGRKAGYDEEIHVSRKSAVSRGRA